MGSFLTQSWDPNLQNYFGLAKVNTTANANYVSPLPATDFYGCYSMKPLQREKFLKWYYEHISSNYVFSMNDEINVEKELHEISGMFLGGKSR